MTEFTGSSVGFLPIEQLPIEQRCADAPASARSRPPRSLRAARELRDTPAPFPFGWFAVAFSRQLRPGQILTRRFMEREIVIFRTRSGIARAIEAYCPHLGAHFGHGGKVDGEELRCPFHGFRYSINGACVHSPYGAPPPAARLGLLELREMWGVILVWHGPPGQVPWEIESLDDELGWHRFRWRTRTYRCDPQELTENSVDTGHFTAVHGCKNVRLTEQLNTDGPRLRISFGIRWLLHPRAPGVDLELRFRIYGVSVQVVDFDLFGVWAVRQFVLYTPADQHDTVGYVGSTVRRRGRSVVGKALWSCLEAVIGRFLMRTMVNFAMQDAPIWNNKKHLGRPAIAAGDGPIAKYRIWAKQFYPEAAKDERAHHVGSLQRTSPVPALTHPPDQAVAPLSAGGSLARPTDLAAPLLALESPDATL